MQQIIEQVLKNIKILNYFDYNGIILEFNKENIIINLNLKVYLLIVRVKRNNEKQLEQYL